MIMNLRKLKKVVTAVAGIALVASLVACSDSGSSADDTNAGAEQGSYTGIVPVFTPRQGGSAFVLGTGIATQLSKTVDGVQGSAEATTGTQEMVQRLADRHAQGTPAFTVMDSAGAAKAVRGESPFETPQTDLRALTFAQEAVAYILTRADSDIQTIADLEGKTIGMGVPGSPVNFLTQEVLEAHGVAIGSYTELPFGYDEVADGLSNRSLDAGVIAGAPPVATITELTASHDVRIIPVDSGILNELNENSPYIYSFESEGGTYNNVDEDSVTFAFSVGVFTHALTDDDLVTEMMKVLFEQTEELVKVHPSAAGITFDNSQKGIAVEYHPAAVEYLTNNGVTLN